MGLDVLFTQSHDSESSLPNIKGTFSGPEGKQTDRFERQHFLDSGNLGEVFFAKDTELNRTVVTKYIRPEMSADSLSFRFVSYEILAKFRFVGPYQYLNDR